MKEDPEVVLKVKRFQLDTGEALDLPVDPCSYPPMVTSVVRCSRHIPLGGDPGGNPGHAKGTMSVVRPR